MGAQPPYADGEAPMQDAELGALRDIFLDEAEELLSLMSDRLGRFSSAETEVEEASLDEVAAAGHTLRGSAALAQLPGLSRAGAVFERAAEIAGEHAQRNVDTARALVREALAAIDRGPTPDVVVSDIAMPGEDGFALMRELRHERPERPIPVLALTAYAGEPEAARIREAGFDTYLAKPIEAAKLVAAVSSLAGVA